MVRLPGNGVTLSRDLSDTRALRLSRRFTERLDRGPKGIRTPDLLAASQTLYQLSYGPQADRKFTQPDEAASESCHLTRGASRHSRSRS